jgi:serine/threonine protein kinase
LPNLCIWQILSQYILPFRFAYFFIYYELLFLSNCVISGIVRLMIKLFCTLILVPILLGKISREESSSYSREPLYIRDDTIGKVTGRMNSQFMEEFAKMKQNILPGTNPFSVDPELYSESDKASQIMPVLKLENRIRDCRAMYFKFRARKSLSNGRNKVFLVQDVISDQLFVYKLYQSPDEYSRELFTMQVANHPNLVKGVCFHQSNNNQRPGIVMEYIEGMTGTDWANQTSYDQIKHIMAQFFVSLKYLHSLGLIHCDVKPRNFIVEKSTGRGVLLDFGLTVPKDDFRYGVGTDNYVAPEMHGKVPGPITFAVDWWGYAMSLAAMAGSNFLGSKYSSKGYYPLRRDKDTGSYEFSPAPFNLPLEVRELMGMMLTVEWQYREFKTTVQRNKIKYHKFFDGVDWNRIDPPPSNENDPTRCHLLSPAQKQLKNTIREQFPGKPFNLS